jgi:catechol 2,3-dioxygenase-like lactoylglutathione lyase family enzyme
MTQADPMAPRHGATPTLCGALECVTIATDDGPAAAAFMTQAMRLKAVAVGHGAAVGQSAAGAEERRCRELWGLAPGAAWRELRFLGPEGERGAALRVLVMDGGELIRPDMDSRLTGGLSIGFPAASLEETLARVTALGFESTAGIVRLTIMRPDGSSYVSGEVLFRGPEQIYMLAVGRPPDMTPVGPIEPATGMGGPAYSALIVPDAAREIEFYREILGWEVRQDIVLTTSGPAGGLGLAAGTQFRFVQLFAPGATTRYVCLLDMLAAGRTNPAAPRLPNRGLVMWTFGTQAFDAVAQRVRAASAAPADGLRLCSQPRFSEPAAPRALTVLSPAGLMIEIIERPGPADPG